jgi:hypothetical protein
MAAFLKGRVSKLETRNRQPARVRHTVLTIDARTGAIIGPMPKGKVCVMPHFGTDAEWSEQLEAQQARLIQSAHIEGTAQ